MDISTVDFDKVLQKLESLVYVKPELLHRIPDNSTIDEIVEIGLDRYWKNKIDENSFHNLTRQKAEYADRVIGLEDANKHLKKKIAHLEDVINTIVIHRESVVDALMSKGFIGLAGSINKTIEDLRNDSSSI